MMYSGMVLYEMTWFDHVVAIIICVFAPVLAYTSRQVTSEDIQLEPGEKIELYHSNALLLFIFGLVVVTIWRLPGRTLEGLGFDWPIWNTDVLLLILAVILFYTLDLFFQYGIKRWREKTLQQKNQTLTFIPADQNELLHFLLLALAAGICEEIIFRGYIIQYITWWTGNSVNGIISACFFASALFAFLHGYQGYRSMIKIFFLAMLFSGIYILSQSLLIVMMIHTIIDVLSGWLGIYILRHLREAESNENIPEQ
jgi:membrane protease YdiL (CAAX protease family)